MVDAFRCSAQPDLVDPLALEPGCPLCDEASIAMAAVDIVIDGDQIGVDCPSCGRLVRPFSWHDDELPHCYVGRIDRGRRTIAIAAWYGAAGLVRSVPAVDGDRPWRHHWPLTFGPDELARAILAHLVGLDVPATVWTEFEADIVGPLVDGGAEWCLTVEEISEWLAANR